MLLSFIFEIHVYCCWHVIHDDLLVLVKSFIVWTSVFTWRQEQTAFETLLVSVCVQWQLRKSSYILVTFHMLNHCQKITWYTLDGVITCILVHWLTLFHLHNVHMYHQLAELYGFTNIAWYMRNLFSPSYDNLLSKFMDKNKKQSNSSVAHYVAL